MAWLCLLSLFGAFQICNALACFDFTLEEWVQKIAASSLKSDEEKFPVPMGWGICPAALRCAGQLVELASDAELGVPWWCKLTCLKFRFFLFQGEGVASRFVFCKRTFRWELYKFLKPSEFELFWSFLFGKSEDFEDLRSSEASWLRNFGRWCKLSFPLRYLTCPKDIE